MASASFEPANMVSANIVSVNDIQRAEELWNSHLKTFGQRQYVDCQLLDAICGKEFDNKHRTMKMIISEMLTGTGIPPVPNVLRKISTPGQSGKSSAVCVAARTMQMILLRGFIRLPWNNIRRSLVALFFPEDMFPDADPYTAIRRIGVTTTTAHVAGEEVEATSSGATGVDRGVDLPPSDRPAFSRVLQAVIPRCRDRTAQRLNIELWETSEGAMFFWQQVFKFVRENKVSLDGLVKFLQDRAKARRRQARRGSTNIMKVLLDGLLTKRGTLRDFCDDLAIAIKTGNMDSLIRVVRDRLEIAGVRHVMPSVRSVKNSTATLISNFISICSPEKTFSGFKVDLVAAVKLAAWLLLQRKDIKGLQVMRTELSITDTHDNEITELSITDTHDNEITKLPITDTHNQITKLPITDTHNEITELSITDTHNEITELPITDTHSDTYNIVAGGSVGRRGGDWRT